MLVVDFASKEVVKVVAAEEERRTVVTAELVVVVAAAAVRIVVGVVLAVAEARTAREEFEADGWIALVIQAAEGLCCGTVVVTDGFVALGVVREQFVEMELVRSHNRKTHWGRPKV